MLLPKILLFNKNANCCLFVMLMHGQWINVFQMCLKYKVLNQPGIPISGNRLKKKYRFDDDRDS